MPNPGFFAQIEKRGLIYQKTDERLASLLDQKVTTLYCGFDPTSDSLHLGSLMPLLMLKRFQMAGHHPIALVGGATGMIGDPSGKSEERQLLDGTTLARNVEGISRVIAKFLDTSGPSAARIENNLEWTRSVTYLDFLRDIGKHFSVNMMLAKDSVRDRLSNRDQGISYTEFSYMLLQAYDFLHLNRKFQCTLQVGGSDQWGNITAGTELIRKMAALGGVTQEAFGATFPLITKSDGQKFGKSEKGNIWLDEKYTSPYAFYQFLVQTSDQDVMKYLRMLTLLPEETIAQTEDAQTRKPENRVAQKLLAAELTRLVHGEMQLRRVLHASSVFFGTEVRSLDRNMLISICSDVPTIKKSWAELEGGQVNLVSLLVESGLCASNGMARKDVQGGGIYLNNDRQNEANLSVTRAHTFADGCLLLRRGKKHYALVLFS